MKKRSRAVLLSCLLAGAVGARAGDRLELEVALDLRTVYSDADQSFLRGGIGKLRFDAADKGLRLGRAMVAADLRLTDIAKIHAVADAYGDTDGNPAGLSELYLDVKPFPTNPLRWRARVGAFYPPASLENRGVGWTSVYTLTPSAANTWLGEEFRIVGAELEARWLGASSGYVGDLAAVGGVYAWNDPAGALIADRGFALSDRPVTLISGLGRSSIAFFREIDRKPGYYGGLSWRHGERLELRALRYDNRGDPGVFNSGGEGAWLTRFTSLGARLEATRHWSFVAQYLDGDTAIGADSSGDDQFLMTMHAAFVLASFEWGAGRLSGRYDHFGTHQSSGFYGPAANDNGHAWTLGWSRSLGEHWRLAAEWLQVTSAFPPRLAVPEAAGRVDSQFQLSLRYAARL